jgi:hypothetical protein
MLTGSFEGSVTIAVATMVSGMRARASLSTNREDTDFETGIALLDPNENPFTLMTMQMGKDTSATIDTHWFEDELVPEFDTVNYGAGYDASSTDIIVDNGDRWAVGDLGRHDLNNEVFLVTAISSNTLTVDRDYGQAEGWTAQAGAIADGDYLTILTNAFEQGHPLPAMRSTLEVEYKNYCQDVRTPLGISEVAEAAAHRGEQDWPFQRRKAGITHQRKLEYMNIWGMPYVGDRAYYVSGTGNTAPSAAGGINYFINRYTGADRKKDEDDLTQDEFQDWLEYLFEYGSETRFGFCAARLRTAFDRWGISKLNTFSTDTVMGMAVAKWLSSHGTVVLKTHKMLKRRQSTDYFYSFFLDFDEFTWVTYANIGSTRLRVLKPYEATGETGKKEEYQTIGCVRYGMAEKHGRLRFKTIS